MAWRVNAGADALSPAEIYQITQLKDAEGRTFVPQGFVANTHVRGDRLDYLPSDYQQMARYGANMQVVRIGLGRLAGWPGYSLEPGYLEQIDQMIENAAAVGIKSGLKMVVYDIKNFRDVGWEALWKNEHGEQELLVKAWSQLWTRYKDNPAVFAYDLLNEPMQGHFEDPAQLEREVLAPLYRKLIDGFKLKIDDVTIFELQVSPTVPGSLKPTMITNPDHGIEVEWRPWPQRIVISGSGLDATLHHLEISPGFTRAE